MSEEFQTLCELILQKVPSDGSVVGNQALIAELQHCLPELTEAEYRAAMDSLVGEGMLIEARGGSVSRTRSEGRQQHTLNQCLHPFPSTIKSTLR